jgi:hypothetical protein
MVAPHHCDLGASNLPGTSRAASIEVLHDRPTFGVLCWRET